MARKDFINELNALGFAVEDRGQGRLAFRYTVELGKFTGQELLIGFVVGDDFPATPPTGPHLSPGLLPLNTISRKHPDGGIHASWQFGEGWQYWSRPFVNWQKTDRTVRAYLAHIRKLFETQ